LKTKVKIGIDEAGRGPWSGPVVACSLAFDPNNPPSKDFLQMMTDSKKLSAKKREELYDLLIEFSRGEKPQVYFGVGVVDNFLIDEINIRQANREAMRRAIVEIQRKLTNYEVTSVVIDGKDNYEFDELSQKPLYII